ncbi:hypothetical protein, partial [Pseudomonas fluorescens]|uniref:hypothetical protein n=1 Tax=Pseudomonas fluorescens TaxID=294 RepID=UPI001C4A5DE1
MNEQYIAQTLTCRYLYSGNIGVLRFLIEKPNNWVDGRFWKPIIRPTSGAVETENSLVNNELRGFRQQVASVHRSQKEVEKEVLTAACNAVEFASRLREIASASG